MGPHSMLGSDPSKVEGVRLQKGVLRRVWVFARPHRWRIVGFLATIVLSALLSLVSPLVFRAIIDDALPNQDRHQLALLSSLVLVAAFGDAVLSFFERWWSSRVGEGLIHDLRVTLFDHVQRLPIAFFTRSQTGALVSRLNNDVIGAQRALTGTLGSVVSNIIVLVTTVTAMALLEWRLTALALVLLPLFVIPAKRVGKRLQAITRQQMDLNAQMNTTMNERFNVGGALLVKLFGRAGDEATGFEAKAAGVRDAGVKAALLSRTFFIALTLVAAVGVAAIYWVGGGLVISGAITTGTLVALAAYVTRIYAPLTALTNARIDVMTAFVSFERVFEVLDLENPIADRPGAIDLLEPEGRLTFEDVCFEYPVDGITLESLEGDAATAPNRSAGPVLKGISAVIEPGQLVALVGPSGAGKTTISNLVPRLYDVTSGAIRVDGHDVRDLTQDSLRAAVGVVSQDSHLFHETIGQNLQYARPDATQAEIETACRAAQIHDLITSLPDGYDTLVGERGYRMSGGEKQRLSIARMLLKDPTIVILDEATSHLDSENEALVQAALASALERRTSLVIAHRLSTITSADQILVVDDGRVVERGVHDSLLVAGGLYADLYRTLLREEPTPV